MTMPVRVLFVRHGESEGNIIEDDPELAAKLKDIPNSEYRLTPKGVQQAQTAGVWLRAYREQLVRKVLAELSPDASEIEIAEAIQRAWRGYTSSFVRPIETMGHLGLGLKWIPYPGLIERNWAQYEKASPEDQKKFKERKRRDPLHAKAHSSQSIGELRESTHTFLQKLHREHTDDTVIAVCHGERMLIIRYILERMTEERFRALVASRHTGDKIRNCQILEYTRINPETGELSMKADWMRCFCPWDLREKDLVWKRIVRATFTDEEALAYAERHPRFLP